MMPQRRHLLSSLVGYMAVPDRLIWRSGLRWLLPIAGTRQALAAPPHPIIHHLLGDHLIPGSTGRLCIIGANLGTVNDVTLPATPVRTEIVSISGTEIVVDVTIPADTAPGMRQIALHTAGGVNHPVAGATVTIAYSTVDACPSSGSKPKRNPAFPGTGGFPCDDRHSQTVERYYTERPAIEGIGANLL
jgi:hypothetical protein